MRRTLPLVLIAVLAAFAAPALGSQPSPRVNISDIEDEVMCPVCGTLLELADSPQARREKAFVARLIAAGRTRSEIKDALVAQYGRAVLAQPPESGFDLTAYLVPAIAFAVAAAALAIGVSRWRRRPDTEPASPQGPPDEEDAERLDADIGRYDL